MRLLGAAIGLLLLTVSCASIELSFPSIALCSYQSAPLYNCSFIRSQHDQTSFQCAESIAHFRTADSVGPLNCSLFNANNAAYASNSYGMLNLTRAAAPQARYAVLFYELPKDIQGSPKDDAQLPPFIPLNELLDLVPLDLDRGSMLLRVLGRDPNSQRYSVITQKLGGGASVLLSIDGIYFAAWQGYYRDLFLDPSTWFLCAVAVLVIWYAAYRSMPQGGALGGAGGGQVEEHEPLRMRMVLVLPVTGSLVLLAMFYFLDLMWPLLFAFCAFTGFVSVAFVLWPVAQRVAQFARLPAAFTCLASRIGEVPSAILIALPISAAVLIAWGWTDIWIFTDSTKRDFFFSSVLALTPLSSVIGLCIAIVSISHLRLPDLRVGAVLLSVFFFYDIFWVFISPYIFSGRSVMYVAHTHTHLCNSTHPSSLQGSRWLSTFGVCRWC